MNKTVVMVNNDNEISVSSVADLLANSIKSIGASILALGKEIAAAIDKYDNITEELINRGIEANIIRRFEMVGRGEIHENLFFKMGNAYKRLENCPISEQKKYSHEPIKVVLPNDGKHISVKLDALTPFQVKQVFAYDHVRTEGEQRIFLESEKSECAVKEFVKTAEKPKYLWDGRNVVCPNAGTRLTEQDLGEIFRKLFKI